MQFKFGFVLIFTSTLLMGQSEILPPSSVPKVIPPYTTIEQANEDLKRKQKRSKKKRLKNQTIVAKSEKDIAPATNPWKTYSRVSLMLPYVKTSGNFRSQYIVEPGANFNFARRWGDSNPYSDQTLWYGLRIASFSGSGTYQNQNGRFNFLYWGPSFSLLLLDDPRVISKSPNGKETVSDNVADRAQNSWRWSFGLSAFSRYGSVDEDLEPGAGDFSNVGYGLDIPGVWTEITYGRIFERTVSFDLTGGAQIGDSKIFIYFSAGMGLWY